AEFYPDELHRLGGGRNFVFAHVPYEIAEFPKLVENPYDSIRFLPELSARLKKQASEIGADGHLLRDASGQLVRASLAEKVLILFLAKLANYVPGGGIWMNTQRPEWNDANNALAAWGLSMVTLAYLYRFIPSLRRILGDQDHIEL